MNVQSQFASPIHYTGTTTRKQPEPEIAETAAFEGESYQGSVAAPADDYLNLGRMRFASPGLVANVEFHFVDGTTVSVPDADAAARQCDKIKDGTLDWMRASGHGSDEQGTASMGFDTNEESAPGLTSTHGGGRPRVTLDVSAGGRTRQVDLGKKLEHKFAPGGARLIRLEACETGNADGMAPTLSKVLPGIRVEGTAGTLLENRLTGAVHPASTPDATRTFVVPRSQAGVTPGSYNAFPAK